MTIAACGACTTAHGIAAPRSGSDGRGFFDRHHESWTLQQAELFDVFLDEEDHDILAWMLGVLDPPPRYAGPMMDAMRRLDYVAAPR